MAAAGQHLPHLQIPFPTSLTSPTSVTSPHIGSPDKFVFTPTFFSKKMSIDGTINVRTDANSRAAAPSQPVSKSTVQNHTKTPTGNKSSATTTSAPKTIALSSPSTTSTSVSISTSVETAKSRKRRPRKRTTSASNTSTTTSPPTTETENGQEKIAISNPKNSNSLKSAKVKKAKSLDSAQQTINHKPAHRKPPFTMSSQAHGATPDVLQTLLGDAMKQHERRRSDKNIPSTKSTKPQPKQQSPPPRQQLRSVVGSLGNQNQPQPNQNQPKTTPKPRANPKPTTHKSPNSNPTTTNPTFAPTKPNAGGGGSPRDQQSKPRTKQIKKQTSLLLTPKLPSKQPKQPKHQQTRSFVSTPTTTPSKGCNHGNGAYAADSYSASPNASVLPMPSGLSTTVSNENTANLLGLLMKATKPSIPASTPVHAAMSPLPNHLTTVINNDAVHLRQLLQMQ